MGKRGFIAYDPLLARDTFNADMVVTIYYMKLLRYDSILAKDSQGFFTRTVEQMEKATCIKRRKQEKARSWLERRSFIIMKMDIPEGKTSPQLHYKLVDENRPL